MKILYIYILQLYSPLAVKSSKNVSNGDKRCCDGNADATPVKQYLQYYNYH